MAEARKRLGVLLMEEPSGQVAVQFFGDPEDGTVAFRNTAGHLGDKPSRATFLEVDWEAGTVGMETKDLPVIKDPNAEPWGIRLGVGPIEEPEKTE